MTGKFAMTEIALQLMGNKFYDIDGNYVDDMNKLLDMKTEKIKNPKGKNLREVLFGVNKDKHCESDEDIILVDEKNTDSDKATINPTLNSNLNKTTLNDQRKDGKLNIENKQLIKDNLLSPTEMKSLLHQTPTTSSNNETKIQVRKTQNRNTKNNNKTRKKAKGCNKVLTYSERQYKKIENFSKDKLKSFLLSHSPTEIKQFYIEQAQTLEEECSALLEFIRYLRNDENNSEKFRSIINDVMEAHTAAMAIN